MLLSIRPLGLGSRDTVESRKWEAVESGFRGILERRGGREVVSQRQRFIVNCCLKNTYEIVSVEDVSILFKP